jgi:hypothetical protein
MLLLRAVYILIITGLCSILMAEGGILFCLIPLAGWGVMEAAGVFKPDRADAGHV